MRYTRIAASLLWMALLFLGKAGLAQSRPNVVLIYADDLGYGDLSCYTPSNPVKTPQMDELARGGRRFTRAYCTGATCTPSRFSLLTGEYPWRRNGVSVLQGDATALLRAGRPTLGSQFQAAGYQTGVVGKWHLGLGDTQGPNWNGHIEQSPNDVGFHYSYIMAATGDRVPTVYVENARVLGLDPNDPIQVDYKNKIGQEPTGRTHPELLKLKHSHGHDFTIVNGVGRIGYMTGGKTARWVDENMADTFTRKAVQFIERHRQAPFFLYFAPHDVHVPRVPHPRFVGKSGMGARGDALLELDWSVGEIMRALRENGLLSNTLVILSSDNGPVIDDGYQDQAVALLGTHQPAGPLRGGKYSIFEAGTRIPLLVYFPQRVKPGVSHALLSQVDFMASLSALIGQVCPPEARDSENLLAALLGKDRRGRQDLITHTQSGDAYALVERDWKYIAPSKGPKMNVYTNTELGNHPEPQLYHLKNDLGERNNQATAQSAIVQRMKERLRRVVEQKP